MDGRYVISPIDDVFVTMVVKIFIGYPYNCQLCLKNSAVIRDFLRVFVNNRVVIIRGNDKADASTLVGAGAVCIT